MLRSSLNRRDFSKLAAAAMGGVVVGSLAIGVPGCNNAPPASTGATPPAATAEATPAKSDSHACAGLNGCKGQGADGKNACAGQGTCATAGMHHECKGHNACKGEGGCGEMGGAEVGKNACKGHGGCAVPMKDETAWKKAREKFEAKMKADGKEVGPAPAKS